MDAQTPQTAGQWGPKKEIGGTAVHLVLMPGNSTYHSKVLWWASSENHIHGLWGWRSFKDSCAAWYDSNFVNLSLAMPPTGAEIFCGSNTILPDGRLFIAGGTDTGSTGIKNVGTYNPETNSWTALNDMAHGRWYATSTVLPDGRVLTGGGNKYFHLYSFGGHPAGTTAPTDSALRRFGTMPDGIWDTAHSTTPSSGAAWPPPRTGAAAYEGDNQQNFYFGGVGKNSDYLNDTWSFRRDPNHLGDDYEYAWTKLTFDIGFGPPTGRRDHSMVRIGPDSMLVIGGRTSSGPTNQVYLLRKSGITNWRWEPMSISGMAPSARYGHAAVLDETRRRIIVYGGTETVGGAPSDSVVWALSYSTWSWDKPPMRTSASPGRRYGHRVALDPTRRARANGTEQYRAVLFGGKDENGTLPQDTWALWFMNTASDTVEWKQMTVTNTPPAGRYFHASAFDESRGLISISRMVVTGGEIAGGGIDSTLWILQMRNSSGDDYGAYWRQLTGAPLSGGRAGHTLLFPGFNTFFPHHPELYDPVSGTWSTQSSSPLLQDWYPHVFVGPGGSVFNAGPDFYSWKLSSIGSSWTKTPNSDGPRLQSAVMYRPGKVMRAGTSTAGDSLTQSIDLNNPTAWNASINKMFLRVEHNMVLLPNGRVLAMGGSRGARDNNKPIRRPQIWNPDTTSGSSVGYWYGNDSGTDTLAQDPAVRVYHSTAVLLPDGRILSAGGDSHADQTTATVYCPSYLFKSDGTLAARPGVSGAPTNASWAAQDDDTTLYVFVSDTTHIQRVALIRSGATTHGFDQNQRYMTLGFKKAAGRLELEAPTDSMVAPPGYYLLFVTGSADGKDVPSLARWIRVGRDVFPGNALNFQIDWVATTSVGGYWNANADDYAEAASGRSSQNDFRYKMSAINNETAWSQSSFMTEPAPKDPGTSQDTTFSGFTPCSTYHFAARSRDDVGNLSPLHGEVSVTMLGTTCGGNLIARPRGDLASLRGRRGATATDGGQSAEVASALIVETHRTGTGGWRIVIRQKDDASTIGGVTSSQGVEIQDANGSGWTTSRASDPSVEEGAIGLCRVRDGGRTVLRNFYLEGIPTRFRTADGTYEIPVAERPETTPNLADGDSLVLEYDPVTGSGEEAPWYVMAARVGGAQLRVSSPEPEIGGEDLPRVFALRQNQPNPFASTTRISFDLPVRIAAQIEIFDLQGRRIRTVAKGERPAGRYSVDWDRRDDEGHVLRPGVYLYSLKAGSFREKKTMVLLK